MFSVRCASRTEKTKGETNATLGDGVDILGISGTKEGAGEDGDRLHLDWWFWCWVGVLDGGLIVAARRD